MSLNKTNGEKNYIVRKPNTDKGKITRFSRCKSFKNNTSCKETENPTVWTNEGDDQTENIRAIVEWGPTGKRPRGCPKNRWLEDLGWLEISN